MKSYQNTPGNMNNYENVILLKIRTSTATSCTKSIKSQNLAVGSPPKLDTI